MQERAEHTEQASALLHSVCNLSLEGMLDGTLVCCSPEREQGSPGEGRQGDGGLAALAQLASPASSRPASRGPASGRAQLAEAEASSWSNKDQHSSHYTGIGADLDFQEFLQRQQRFLQVRNWS